MHNKYTHLDIEFITSSSLPANWATPASLDLPILLPEVPDRLHQQQYWKCKEIIDDMKYTGRGFILQPSCDLPMNAKSINLYAMLKACRDFGNYMY